MHMVEKDWRAITLRLTPYKIILWRKLRPNRAGANAYAGKNLEVSLPFNSVEYIGNGEKNSSTFISIFWNVLQH